MLRSEFCGVGATAPPAPMPDTRGAVPPAHLAQSAPAPESNNFSELWYPQSYHPCTGWSFYQIHSSPCRLELA